MDIKTHLIKDKQIAEIIDEGLVVDTLDAALDLLGTIYYDSYDKLIIHEHNLPPTFFDLSSKLAGEVLQKFAQYQMPITIVGNFNKYESQSLKDFIRESNKGKQVNFLSNVEEALSLQG